MFSHIPSGAFAGLMSPSTVAGFLLPWGFQLGQRRWRYEKVLLSIVAEGMEQYLVASETDNDSVWEAS